MASNDSDSAAVVLRPSWLATAAVGPLVAVVLDQGVRYYVRAYPANDPLLVATFIAVGLSEQQIVVAAIEAIGVC